MVAAPSVVTGYMSIALRILAQILTLELLLISYELNISIPLYSHEVL